MPNLTTIILTKNEEKNIRKSISFAQKVSKRIVIVDSFSEDKTKEICLEENVDFYEHDFITFAEKLNWALSNTDIKTEWVMRLDADEELTDELVNEINLKLDYLPKEITGVMLNRRIYFLGKWIKHGGIYPMKLLRIFRNNIAFCEDKIIDEHMVLKNGQAIQFKYDFIDNDTKDLKYWINKHNNYSSNAVFDYFNVLNESEDNDIISSNLTGEQFQRKRWLKNNVFYKLPLFLRAKIYFYYRYIFRLGFLDGREGKIYHFLQAYWYRFLVDSKIYEYEKYGKDREEINK